MITLDEAEKLAKIAGQIDNACSVCVGSFVEKLNAIFPEIKWTMTDINITEYIKFDNKTDHCLIVTEDEDWDFTESRLEIKVEIK